MQNLINQIIKKDNPTVVGLDPQLQYIPDFIKQKAFSEFGKTLEGAAEAIFEFNKGLIDHLCDIVPAVKPQSAYYEMYGIPGIVALSKTIKYAKEKGLYVILDVKRNDIGSTAEAYSAAYIGETAVDDEKFRAFECDGITINPYFGLDGIQPFIFDANRHSKTVFVLVKTSNASSGDFQDLKIGDKALYEIVAEKINEWSIQCIGMYNYSQVGCVVGATYPEQAKKLRHMMPHCYFLVPGYGAQGAKAEDVAVCFDKDGLGAIVNSSRAVIYAYRKGSGDGSRFGEDARNEAIRMREDIKNALVNYKIGL